MRAPIHSEKHYVQKTLTTVVAGATDNIVLCEGTDTPVANDDVHVGAVVKAIFVEMWARGGETSPGSVLITLMKIPGVGGLPTFAKLIDLNTYDNKKNVLYHTQGLTNINGADAIPFVRGWFKIPKGKQRIGLEDRIILSVSAQALDTNICGFATYKEYQ